VPWSEAPWIGVRVAASRTAAVQQRVVVGPGVATGGPRLRVLVQHHDGLDAVTGSVGDPISGDVVVLAIWYQSVDDVLGRYHPSLARCRARSTASGRPARTTRRARP
jgi:hypothetical protein